MITLRAKEEASSIYLCDDIHGDEKFDFIVGQTVLATGSGQMKAEIEITDRFEENGFCKYFGNGMWHHQRDLTIEVT